EVVTAQYTDARQLLLRGIEGTSTYLSDRRYNHYGQITQHTFGTMPATTQIYSYYALTTPNGQGRVQSVLAGSGFNTRQHLQYTYDPTGNILSINDAANGNQLQTF